MNCELICNLSTLLAMSVLSGFVDLRWNRKTLFGRLLQGLVFGCATAIGMLRPYVIGDGLFFDGRSVMISLVGLFFGTSAAVLAAVMTIMVRVALGGAGVAMGIMVIVSSAAMGSCFNRRWQDQLWELSSRKLLVFGLAVSGVMLTMTLALDTELVLPVIKRIAAPVMLLYPLATVLVGKILVDQGARGCYLSDLQASEARHRQILQMAMDGYRLSDLQGRILEVNAAYVRMTGYERSELLQKNILDLEEQPHEKTVRLQEIKRLQSLRYETRHRRKDGTVLDLEVSEQYWPEKKGGQIVAFLHDISERKQAEEALKDSEERMRYVIEHNQNAVAIHDRDMNYVYVSKRYLHDYGVKEDDIIGKNHYDVLPDIPMKWRAVHQRALAGEVLSADEDSYERADGSMEWTRWECRPWRQRDGSVGGIIVYTEVITAQKLARDYQRMSLEVLRILNVQRELRDSIRLVLDVLRQGTGFDAVGLRLRQNDDYPYYEQRGFSSDFLQEENSLVERDANDVCRDACGCVSLECTCGLVISGKTDPSSPLFTREGSFWTNDSRVLLKIPADQDPRRNPRNHCIHQDYASVALIPLRHEGQIIGLLQLNNCRKNSFTLETVERLELIAFHIAEALVRRQAVDSLRESEERFRRAVVDSPMPTLIHAEDGSVLQVSRTWCEITGYTREELATISDWTERAYGERKHIFQPDIDRLYALNERTHEGDFVVRTKSGETRIWDFSTAPIGRLPDGRRLVISMALDVTDRRATEQALKASEERLSLTLRVAHMGVWLWDIDSDKRHFDDQTCALLGLDAKTFKGTANEFFSIVHADDRDILRRCLSQTVAFDIPYTPEYRVLLPDGTIRPIAASGRLIRNEAGKPKCIMGVVWDNTEHVLMLQQQQRARTLESIGTLAGGIAHDFNNILLGVFGYISLAKEALPVKDPAFAYLEESERSMARAVRLTQQLLTFSKGGVPVREDVDLGELAEDVARFDLSGSNVRLLCRRQEGLWLVDVDKGQIQQVISNLVINARQAMPVGGVLSISLENADFSEQAVPPLLPGRYVKVSISDEGHGIERSALGRIFEPYFTTKRTGSGLGLATALSIVSRHGGDIRVDSELGKGTTFTLYLPAAVAKRTAEVKRPAREKPALRGPARILVMDDEIMIGRLVERMLKTDGHRVDLATDANQAVAMYRESLMNGTPYDLVILDLTIVGGPGGVEVIKEIRALDPNVKAIASSGYAESDVMSDPVAYGFVSMVAKPYTMSVLHEAVARVLG